ncbi:replication initiator protein A [Priestia megaterium]
MSVFSDKVKEFAAELIQNDKKDDEIAFLEAAKRIEAMRKFKLTDFKVAKDLLQEEELKLYKQKEKNGKVIEKSVIETIETAVKLVEKARELRRVNSRLTSKVDTNILNATPFYPGRSKKLIDQGKKQGYITFEQEGVRKLTYHNDMGLLLTLNDAKTLFALFALWDDQGQNSWLSFTEYQLLDKMNMGYGGRQYQMLRDSLEKLRNTSVVFQDAYDIKTGTRYVTERFNLIIADREFIDEDQSGRVRSRKYEIQFSPHIYESIENGYYSLISLALWDELRTDTSKAIYSMISGIGNMANKEEYIREDQTYLLPINVVYKQLKLESPKPVRNKEVVERACEDLVNAEVIEKFYFMGSEKGNRVHSLVIKPSEWLINILSKTKQKPLINGEQLNLPLN